MSNRLMQFCAIIALTTSSIFLSACMQDDSANSPSNTATTSNASGTGAVNQATSTYYGSVDFRDCETVKGWVWNSADPKADIKVGIYIDDKLIETVPARTLRADVKAQKIGTGEYGFSSKIPPSFKDGKPHTVSVKTVDSDYTLNNVEGLFPTVTCKP